MINTILITYQKKKKECNCNSYVLNRRKKPILSFTCKKASTKFDTAQGWAKNSSPKFSTLNRCVWLNSFPAFPQATVYITGQVDFHVPNSKSMGIYKPSA